MKKFPVHWCFDCPANKGKMFLGEFGERLWCSELRDTVELPSKKKPFPTNCPLEDYDA